VARLKGEKGKPDIKKTVGLEGRTDDKSNNKNKNRKRGKKIRNKKTKSLIIHDTKFQQPDVVPEGSVFKGYKKFVVQDIKIENNNIVYKLARYTTPEGKYIIGKLPEHVAGCHYGVVLRAYILNQYYQLGATQNVILQQLRDFGVLISAGQLNDLIIAKHDIFHEEKSDILDSGLKNSDYIETDDTVARHKGKNGYCNRIGNHLFTCFNSTSSKSRINFLELLRNRRIDYTINKDAILYCKHMGLSKEVIEVLRKNTGNFKNKTDFLAYLLKLGIKNKVTTQAAFLNSSFL
jgi:hypothetical protein